MDQRFGSCYFDLTAAFLQCIKTSVEQNVISYDIYILSVTSHVIKKTQHNYRAGFEVELKQTTLQEHLW